ncbi:MAG: hypothetical protein ACREOQ_06095 [Gemmatimonadales bacterium]
MSLRIWGLILCLGGALPNTAFAQQAFDTEYIKALTSLISLIRSLSRGVDSLVADETAAQLERRTKRLSGSLFDLCAKKRQLIGSLKDSAASPDEISEDAYRIQGSLQNVADDYQCFGAVLSQKKYREYETTISRGLAAKAIDINAFIHANRGSNADRTALVASAEKAESLCVQVQESTADLAVRLHQAK